MIIRGAKSWETLRQAANIFDTAHQAKGASQGGPDPDGTGLQQRQEEGVAEQQLGQVSVDVREEVPGRAKHGSTELKLGEPEEPGTAKKCLGMSAKILFKKNFLNPFFQKKIEFF